MFRLCTQSRALWVKYNKAFINGLREYKGTRVLKCARPFSKEVAEYFYVIEDPIELQFYEYVLVLKKEESIREFCEFIESYKHRDKIQFKQIFVHYDRELDCALLNSPYDVLKKYTLDISCIQVEGLMNFEPENIDDILKYTSTLTLDTFVHNSETQLEEKIRDICIKEAPRFCFNDAEFSSCDDLANLEEVLPKFIRESCRVVCIRKFNEEGLFIIIILCNLFQKDFVKFSLDFQS
ncbi:unnamed protein product [Moneuplotes crassus]|uniref:Uncharacterized protein n=1 Tax=Euplotes crassus TaxID=5936 RepID=A0AAD1UE28_EUPCR|nr:unnamed protein product [Moneuplotes crassus]